ncbi:hypothetical protein PSYMP_13469, partial [Pseudomonas amygdali pv. morsprunorum str. M302280]
MQQAGLFGLLGNVSLYKQCYARLKPQTFSFPRSAIIVIHKYAFDSGQRPWE